VRIDRAESIDHGERVLRGTARFRPPPLHRPPAVHRGGRLRRPGNFATNIAGGSKYGYTLVWVIVASNLMAMLIQTLSAKLGVATGRNLAEVCRDRFPRRVVKSASGSRRRRSRSRPTSPSFSGRPRPAPCCSASPAAGCGHHRRLRVCDPRPAAVRLPAARGGDRGDGARDRRLLRRRALSRRTPISLPSAATPSCPSSRARARCCSRSGFSVRR